MLPFLSLPLLSLFTPSSCPLYCFFIAPSYHFHCPVTPSSLPLPSIVTPSSLPHHSPVSPITPLLLSLHSLFTPSSLPITLILLTPSSLRRHSLVPPSSPPLQDMGHKARSWVNGDIWSPYSSASLLALVVSILSLKIKSSQSQFGKFIKCVVFTGNDWKP